MHKKLEEYPYIPGSTVIILRKPRFDPAILVTNPEIAKANKWMSHMSLSEIRKMGRKLQAEAVEVTVREKLGRKHYKYRPVIICGIELGMLGEDRVPDTPEES